MDRRFDLLTHEMSSIQAGIQAYDKLSQQTKSWCVTVVAGVSVAAATTRSLVILAAGMLLVAVFWAIDSRQRSIQAVYINRDKEIARALATAEVDEAIASHLVVAPQLALEFTTPNSWIDNLRRGWSKAARESVEPVVHTPYALLLLVLAVELCALGASGVAWVPA